MAGDAVDLKGAGQGKGAFRPRRVVVLAAALSRIDDYHGTRRGIPCAIHALTRVNVLAGLVGDQKRCARVVREPRLIVKVVVDDNLHHGEHHGGVCSRIDGDPLVRNGGSRAHARVDDDELGALLPRLDKIAERTCLRIGRVGTEPKQKVRIQEVGRVVARVGVSRHHGIAHR